VKKLTTEKRAFYLATLGIPQDLIGQLLVSYHFTYKRGMMSAFLNALGIANEDGVIGDSTEVAKPESESVAKAVETIQDKFPPQDLYIYLATLHAQNPETWGGVEPVLAKLHASTT
jgi:hypothetical protein